jgi:NTE family protein
LKRTERELFITGTNLNDGTSKIFNSGEIIKPLLASASIPGVFTPIQINKDQYVDGGILNNFPVEPLIGLCDLIIGVYVNPLDNFGRKFNYSYQVMSRAYQIAIGHQSKLKFKHCDLLVLPDGLIKYGVFSLNNLDEIFETGYMAAKTLLSEKADILKQYHESIVSSP